MSLFLSDMSALFGISDSQIAPPPDERLYVPIEVGGHHVDYLLCYGRLTARPLQDGFHVRLQVSHTILQTMTIDMVIKLATHIWTSLLSKRTCLTYQLLSTS